MSVKGTKPQHSTDIQWR